jgi:hypothetical protein
MDDLLMRLALWQVALPVALIAVHAALPAATLPGLALRTAAILLVVGYTALAGLWLFPPWWTPHLLAVLTLVASLRLAVAFRRRRGGRARKVAEVAVALALAAGATLMILPALQGRVAPEVAIDLDMPLGPGRYLVISGGTTPALNAHLLTLTLDRAADFRGQSHGVDIIATEAFGRRATGIRPRDPRAYAIYGREVRAPCSGRAVAAFDGVPDNDVPRTNRDRMAGNHVILDCDGVAVVLAHFAPGSVRVRPGDEVEAGQPIARVGNSGNSDEPHLHVHAQTPASPGNPLSGTPLWFTIEGDLPVRNARLRVAAE